MLSAAAASASQASREETNASKREADTLRNQLHAVEDLLTKQKAETERVVDECRYVERDASNYSRRLKTQLEVRGASDATPGRASSLTPRRLWCVCLVSPPRQQACDNELAELRPLAAAQQRDLVEHKVRYLDLYLGPYRPYLPSSPYLMVEHKVRYLDLYLGPYRPYLCSSPYLMVEHKVRYLSHPYLCNYGRILI